MRLSSDTAANSQVLHQPCHRAGGGGAPVAAQLAPDPAQAFVAPVAPEATTTDHAAQCFVPARTAQPPCTVSSAREVIAGGGRGKWQRFADWRDPVLSPMVVEDFNHHFERQSNSANAKHVVPRSRRPSARHTRATRGRHVFIGLRRRPDMVRACCLRQTWRG